MKSMIFFSVGGGIIALILWWAAMMLLRKANWLSPSKRRFDTRGGNNRSEEIKYHNEAIYRDFEYFFKVTLAILGGIAFVATRENVTATEISMLLLLSAGGIQVIAGATFALFIFFHQKSKIERWNDYFSWWKPALWQECWMIVSMFAVSAGIGFGAIPELLSILSRMTETR
ncbi:MAG: hypothetical protein IID13_04955 [Candidatus Marinimicrobia bacterium]|nr:hypothetical protein [Candidatus Neomarinimicrobiota bacterium]